LDKAIGVRGSNKKRGGGSNKRFLKSGEIAKKIVFKIVLNMDPAQEREPLGSNMHIKRREFGGCLTLKNRLRMDHELKYTV